MPKRKEGDRLGTPGPTTLTAPFFTQTAAAF